MLHIFRLKNCYREKKLLKRVQWSNFWHWMKSSQIKLENFLIRWRNSENFIKMICQDKCWKIKIISWLSVIQVEVHFYQTESFESKLSTLVEKVKHHLLPPCLPGESLLRKDTVTMIRLDFWKGELSHGDHIMTLYREWTTRRRV